MKHSTFLKLSLLVLMGCMPMLALAEWGTQTRVSTVYQKEGEIMQFHTARTSDGYTYMAWAEWNTEYSPAICMMLCMQLLDPDGNPQWGDEGIVVDSYPTRSFTSANSLVVDNEGNAIVSWCDSRSQKDKTITEEDARYDNFEPVLYKVNKEGELIWGEDGVAYDPTNYSMCPVLYSAGGNLYATIYGIGSGSFISSYFVRLDPATGEFIGSPKNMGGQFIQSVGTDIINVYSASGQTLAMRYNQNLEPVWSSPAVVAPYVYEGHSNFPYNLVKDYLGGVIVSFERSTNSSKWMPIVNYITADGESPFGQAVDVITNEANNNTFNTICYNPHTEEILNIWGSNNFHLALQGQMMDIFGERLWGNDGIDFANKTSTTDYTYAPISITMTNDNLYWILYVDESNWMNDTMYLICINGDGEIVENAQRVGPYNRGVISPSVYWEDGSMYMIYYNYVSNTGVYSIQTLSVTDFYESPEFPDEPVLPEPDDPSNGVETIENGGSGASSYYTIDGMKLSGPQKGLNIIKGSDGVSKKVIIK